MIYLIPLCCLKKVLTCDLTGLKRVFKYFLVPFGAFLNKFITLLFPYLITTRVFCFSIRLSNLLSHPLRKFSNFIDYFSNLSCFLLLTSFSSFSFFSSTSTGVSWLLVSSGITTSGFSSTTLSFYMTFSTSG